ncbi:MAG: papain-like cysteine protease family protein [Bacillota bacterium]
MGSNFIIARCLAALGAGLLLGLGGCANAKHYRGLELVADQQGTVVTVPGVAQTENNDCGYAALASVALYHHVPAEKLAAGTIPESFKGPRLSADDLIKMASLLDLMAFGYQGDVEDLRKNIAKGRPVLVLLDHPPRLGNYPGLEWYTDVAAMPFSIPHWMVVAGFAGHGDVVLHDPRNGMVCMSERDFVELWKKRSRVAVLVVPKVAK